MTHKEFYRTIDALTEYTTTTKRAVHFNADGYIQVILTNNRAPIWSPEELVIRVLGTIKDKNVSKKDRLLRELYMLAKAYRFSLDIESRPVEDILADIGALLAEDDA